MEKIECKIHTCLICFIFLLPFFLTSCKSGITDEEIARKYSTQIDDTIYFTTLPSNVYLNLGESVLIENAHTIVRFIEVLEYNKSNSAVRLQIKYENGTAKSIVLNTNSIPQTYILEEGYNFDIHLKEVYYTGNTYQIMFVLNGCGGV